MKIVNLTPHVIRLNNGAEYQPSGIVARVSATHQVESYLSDGPNGLVAMDDDFYRD